ncbi:F-box only protein 40 [Esox lucius]|uniref:F-box protein 40 n=1 Tax=Esox lucius TaxID=8010 RepID=A0A3P9ALX9_ESOLU|nr:F-box only protein 40 [Esox lucius]
MVKSRTPPTGLHDHCEKCYNLFCQAPVNTAISCAVIKCRLRCGASFHKCKDEQHRLLCLEEKVPCLNVGYGCPFSMPRRRLAQHLEACPASTLICSQQWIRFPATETDSGIQRTTRADPDYEKQLNVSTALRDQDLLFRSLKMKTVFPELMERVEEESAQNTIFVGATSPAGKDLRLSDSCKLMEDGCDSYGDDSQVTTGSQMTPEERKNLAKNMDMTCSIYEATLRRNEKGGQRTFSNMDTKPKPTDSNEERACSSSNGHREMDEDGSSMECRNNRATASAVEISGSGLAPWQDGVVERLRREATIADYNMYLLHHGAMLINFGQLDACTPREKDFVYGNLEPIAVQTVRTFSVPTSFRPKRFHVKGTCSQMVSRSVDTADLGVSVEDLSKCDEVKVTLLCFLERELLGHSISEGGGADGLYVDIGTQTYNLPSAPFKPEASLADLLTDQHKDLYVQVQAEDITRRHNSTNSAFSFLCGHAFRRDEYATHFRNVHLDIQSCLNGWFEQRCPLAYLGCDYCQSRFHPMGQRATVTYHQDLSMFTLKPEGPSLMSDNDKTIMSERKPSRNLDHLSKLPFEILQYVAGYLDSFSLSQLSQVSQLLREVCVTLLEVRGMVYLKWERKTYSHGGSKWKCRKKVWEFSSLFSKVDRWCFDNDVTSMSEHLKVCPFYQREERREPVQLPSSEGPRGRPRVKSVPNRVRE